MWAKRLCGAVIGVIAAVMITGPVLAQDGPGGRPPITAQNVDQVVQLAQLEGVTGYVFSLVLQPHLMQQKRLSGRTS